jgi:DNA primase
MMISHPDKILFPADGITKGELAAYYEMIAPVMLPHLRRRPITMDVIIVALLHRVLSERCRQGISRMARAS